MLSFHLLPPRSDGSSVKRLFGGTARRAVSSPSTPSPGSGGRPCPPVSNSYPSPRRAQRPAATGFFAWESPHPSPLPGGEVVLPFRQVVWNGPTRTGGHGGLPHRSCCIRWVARAACPPVGLRSFAAQHWRASGQWHTLMRRKETVLRLGEHDRSASRRRWTGSPDPSGRGRSHCDPWRGCSTLLLGRAGGDEQRSSPQGPRRHGRAPSRGDGAGERDTSMPGGCGGVNNKLRDGSDGLANRPRRRVSDPRSNHFDGRR